MRGAYLEVVEEEKVVGQVEDELLHLHAERCRERCVLQEYRAQEWKGMERLIASWSASGRGRRVEGLRPGE